MPSGVFVSVSYSPVPVLPASDIGAAPPTTAAPVSWACVALPRRPRVKVPNVLVAFVTYLTYSSVASPGLIIIVPPPWAVVGKPLESANTIGEVVVVRAPSKVVETLRPTPHVPVPPAHPPDVPEAA